MWQGSYDREALAGDGKIQDGAGRFGGDRGQFHFEASAIRIRLRQLDSCDGAGGLVVFYPWSFLERRTERQVGGSAALAGDELDSHLAADQFQSVGESGAEKILRDRRIENGLSWSGKCPRNRKRSIGEGPMVNRIEAADRQAMKDEAREKPGQEFFEKRECPQGN